MPLGNLRSLGKESINVAFPHKKCLFFFFFFLFFRKCVLIVFLLVYLRCFGTESFYVAFLHKKCLFFFFFFFLFQRVCSQSLSAGSFTTGEQVVKELQRLAYISEKKEAARSLTTKVRETTKVMENISSVTFLPPTMDFFFFKVKCKKSGNIKCWQLLLSFVCT